MEKFTLNHVVLYAKGWYKRDTKKTIWEDFQKLLDADGYTTWEETPDKNRIVHLVLTQCQRLGIRQFDLVEFYEGIQERNSWRIGYDTKGNCFTNDTSKYPVYDVQESVIRYCLSVLFSLDSEFWDKCPPDYKNVLPRKNGITNKNIKKIFGKL